ncbi:MAG: methionyl-tRNA formyltransferase [bacterium]|nr:methionyl-tRNA formyltransferase [bacterium]
MKIIFMGTAQFAVPILDKIIHSVDHDVLAVVTNIDKPGGRGRKLLPSPVKNHVLNLSIPILQPEKLKDQKFIDKLCSFDADIFVVVAFRILPEAVFSIPKKGTINLHASLLPKYRGPAPIQWALINGEKETGLTTFRIDSGIDTGKMLLQKKIVIAENETAGELAERMSVLGADLVVETLDRIGKGNIKETIQNTSGLSKAPKITPELMNIDWDKPAEETANLISGLSPAAAARTKCGETGYKIYRASAADITLIADTDKPGQIIKADKNDGFLVSTGRGLLKILEIQRQGKKVMKWQDFIRGMPLKVGDIFS